MVSDERRIMLAKARGAARLPAEDLDRARAFYRDKLGLEPVDERPGGLLYELANCEFALFQSTGTSPGTFTQFGFEVDDIEGAVRAMKERGVEFMELDAPGLTTVGGIAEIEGNYPSKNSSGERAAWFHDSEGNLLGMGERLP
jgi:catechol 2,3-dioxygenase-like lactoylglutathione lyase family enzyme